ncbi:MAG: VPLPA-CTERM sorting domain-containing protein [Boseongicola sp.]|nr:MAG: VPLPA-CTERM sorting domain-containing protein [Boseongicola sp.]
MYAVLREGMGVPDRVSRAVRGVMVGAAVMFIRSISLSAVLIAAASSATAATYAFDLQIGGDDANITGNVMTVVQEDLSGVEGDLTGTFEARYFTGATYVADEVATGTDTDAHSVRRFYNGIGVCNDGPCYTSDPLHTVDGSSGGGTINDFVEMSFAMDGTEVEVSLVSLVFGWVGDFVEGGASGYGGTNGSYEVILDTLEIDGQIGIGDALGASGIASVLASLPGYGTAQVDFDGTLIDSMFGVKAGENGSWKLRTVVVNYTPTVVPLSAAGWLLFAGIGGLAALRRKCRSA